ncbi:MAG: O-antigen ligase family protein [Mobilicoccus sp.]|nr:O-antigen ligase family protein [Mobilicoccus sp.]
MAVAAVVLLLAFRQNASLPATLGSTWTQVLMLLCGMAWVVSRIYRDPDPTARDGAWLFAVANTSVTLLSWSLSSMRGIPLGADRETMDLAIFQEVIVLLFFGFLLCNLVSLRSAILTAQAIVIGITVSAAYALLEVFTGVDLAAMIRPPLTRAGGSVLSGELLREGMVRAQGAAGHPLELAVLLATVLPLGVALIFVARARNGRPWFWAGCSALIALAIATSLSRASILSIGLAFSVMGLFWGSRRMAAVVAAGIAGAGLVVLVRPGVLLAFISVFAASGTDDSLYSREFGRAYAVDQWLRHPFFGIGYSGYAVPYNPVLDNQYLARLVETGVAGVVTMVVLWGSAVVVAVRAASRIPREAVGDSLALRELAIGIVGTLTVVLLSNTVLDTLGFRQVATMTYFLLALAWATKRLAVRNYPPHSRATTAPLSR